MGSLWQLFIMQLGKSFLLLISLVLAYCAADIQVQQLENSLEEVTDIETGGLDVKDELEVLEDETEENLEGLEELELGESDSFEGIEETYPIEEVILPENIIEELDDAEDSIPLAEEIKDESEDDFSEFDEEDRLTDIVEAAEFVSEDIESEKKVGFFGRLARTLSFDSFEGIEETYPIEEVTLPENIIEELDDVEDSIPLAEEIKDESEEDFSEFDEEDRLMDIVEAAELVSEEIESEKKVGFFGRLARTLSFGRKN